MTVVDAPVEQQTPGRARKPNLGREPQRRFGDLDRRTKRFLGRASFTLFITILVVGFLMPLVYMAVTSLKSEDQLANGRLMPESPATVEIDGEEYDVYSVPFEDGDRALALVRPGRQVSVFVDPDEPGVEIEWEGNWRILPQEFEIDPQLDNFTDAWDALDYPMLLRNTAIIAGFGMAGTVIASTFVAYGLSRFRMPGKKLIIASLLATIILPRFVTLVPQYAVFNRLGWIGTFLPLIVPHFFANAYNVFLLRQFFMTIPRELDEAAAIDGAGPVRTLLFVIVPQAKGAILAVALFHFFFAWNDFLEPLVYLSVDRGRIPISVGLYEFLGLYDTDIPLMQAGALIAMAVPILVFLGLQRIFLRGIDLSGAIK